jgi:FMN reductase [NAD(P)H]
MELRDVLSRRRSVRTYADRPVSREVLERITNAAVVRAPSAGFSQGLRLVVVTDPETRREIAVAGAEEELAAKGRQPWKAAAPVHVVVLTREDDYHDRYRARDKLQITGGREIDWPAPYGRRWGQVLHSVNQWVRPTDGGSHSHGLGTGRWHEAK